MSHNCNLSTCQTKARGEPSWARPTWAIQRVLGQPELQSQTLSKQTNKYPPQKITTTTTERRNSFLSHYRGTLRSENRTMHSPTLRS